MRKTVVFHPFAGKRRGVARVVRVNSGMMFLVERVGRSTQALKKYTPILETTNAQ